MSIEKFNMNKEQILELEITQKVISLLINDFDKGYEALIDQLENSTKLVAFFQNYMVDRWTVDNITINDISFEQNRKEGSIDLVCGISLYNGCRDLNGEDEYNDNISFEIDYGSSIITIIGSPITEPRTTLDEF